MAQPKERVMVTLNAAEHVAANLVKQGIPFSSRSSKMGPGLVEFSYSDKYHDAVTDVVLNEVVTPLEEDEQ